MRRIVCYLFFLNLWLLSLNASTYQINPHTAKTVLAALDDQAIHWMNFLKVPGVVIGVVVDDEIVYSKAFGKRDLVKDLPMTTSTVMPIGSATKSFTSFLLGQLVDEGVLNWDDPVSEHIPKFKLIDPSTTYEITIRDFLTHVSGYSRNDGSWYGGTPSRKNLIYRMRYFTPIYGLRERFHYGNIGYMIAAHTAELIKEKSWEELIQEYILNPLEMSHTTMSLEELAQSSDFAHGYQETKFGNTPSPFVNAYTIGPAASINSNIEDLLKWVKMLVNPRKHLIKSETFEELISPQVISNLILNKQYGIEDLISKEAYGLGWFAVSYRHHEAVFHGGNLGGFSSNIVFLPKEKIGVVILTNKQYTPLPYLLGCEIIDRVLGMTPIDWTERFKQFSYYGPEEGGVKLGEQKITKSDKHPISHSIEEFAGVYENPGYGKFEIASNGNKLEVYFNSLHFPLEHIYYDTFMVDPTSDRLDLHGLKFAFRQNFHGEIDTLSVPLDPMTSEITFKKSKDRILFQDGYLEKFSGTYKYLGFDFIIERENGNLTVKAMGQPPFILIPEKDGLFTVKDYQGHNVVFFTDEEEKITGVQLIQPNNTTYTAYRVIKP